MSNEFDQNELIKYLTNKPKLCSKCHTKNQLVFHSKIKCLGPYNHSDHNGVECLNCGEIYPIDVPCLGFGDLLELIEEGEAPQIIQNILPPNFLGKYGEKFSFGN